MKKKNKQITAKILILLMSMSLALTSCTVDFQSAFITESYAADFQLQALKYSGTPYVTMDNNNPGFSNKEKKKTNAFEKYSQLDSKGRCGVAFANICKKLMPKGKRGNISSVHPTGWHSNMGWQRCHLIGYQLAGENANERNLITGTQYMNVSGMLPFENMVADYVKETGNHVLYKVTPNFKKNNLIASGVEMEAWSVEDGGKGICFDVYCFNVNKTGKINYKTGVVSGTNQTKTKKVKKPDKKSNKGGGKTVYWTPSGSVYHSTSKCRTLSRSKTIYKGTIKQSGKSRACKICF